MNSCIISKAIEKNLLNITKSFEKADLNAKHNICEILNELDLPTENVQIYSPPVQVILNFTMVTVKYFFVCCKETGNLNFPLLL